MYVGRAEHADIARGRFVVDLAETQRRLGPNNWSDYMKKDAHVKQAMLASSRMGTNPIGCPISTCGGTVSSGTDGDGRW